MLIINGGNKIGTAFLLGASLLIAGCSQKNPEPLQIKRKDILTKPY